MKKSSAVFLFSLMVIFCGCDYSRYNYDFFEGNWMLQNYFDTVLKYRSGTELNTKAPHELIFKRNVDSVYMYYAFEDSGIMCFFERKSSNNIIVHAEKPLSIFITKSAKYIKYKDGDKWLSYIKPAAPLIDSTTKHPWPVASANVLNAVTISGIYKTANDYIVHFTSAGIIKGIEGFDSYRVIYGKQINPGIHNDLICMSGESGTKYFTWKWFGRKLIINELNDQVNVAGKHDLLFELTRLAINK